MPDTANSENTYATHIKFLTWRKTQRRLVSKTPFPRLVLYVSVQGEKETVMFEYDRIDIDPYTRTKKRARIYRPRFGSPAHTKDITLYEHF